MQRIIALTFMVTILFSGTNALSEVSTEGETALTNANEWLTLIDNEKYIESWSIASSLFKSAITSAQWEQSLLSARKPLGKLVSRKVIQQEHYTSLPGAPDGNYYVIQYDSKFENKTKATETITMSKGKDHTWKSSGYFIK